MNRNMMQKLSVYSIVFFALSFLHTPVSAQFMPGVPMTQTESLGNGLYAFRWGPYRSIFLVSDAGVIVTDPINAQAAEAYRAAILEVTDQPVKFVVYSHSHWDHTAGGKIFKDEGAQFIAQEKCVENLAWSPNPDVVMPDITFSDRYTVSVGDASLDLFYFGPIHDTCMAVMVARPANILFTVDITSPGSGRTMPFDETAPDFHFYNAVNYLKSVEALVDQENITSFIGGHLVIGEDENGKRIVLPSAGSVSAITERREFWEQVLAAVKDELDAGTMSLIVHNKIDLTQFEDVKGFSEKKMRALLKRVASYYITGR